MAAADLVFEGPRPQRRWTIALRAILAIPHWLYVVVLSFVWMFAVIAIWFVALVTARAPMGIAELVARIIQYQTTVYAYSFYVMSDRYPGFDLRAGDYPVELELDAPPRLNRAAVLFRGLLMVPALIVSQLASAGAFVVVLFVWLVALITGRVPDSAYFSFAAVLRYQMRTWAYGSMLTSEYPHGLFGDKTGMYVVAPPDAQQAGDGTTLAAAGAPPRIRTLLLGRGAKNLVVLFLVLGVATQVGSTAVQIAAQDDGALGDLEAAYLPLEDATQAFFTDIQSCAFDGDPLCLQQANNTLAGAFGRFRASLSMIDLPAGTIDEAEAVDRSAAEMQRLLGELAGVTDQATYQRLATSLQAAGVEFDRSFAALYDAVQLS
jgi:hypothetical protein